MRLIRGTGMRGLGGIYPRILVEHDDAEDHGEIIRPLLRVRRRELQQYLASLKHPWREDPTNADSKFTRNRVRKLVLPAARAGIQSRSGREFLPNWQRLPAMRKITGRTKSRAGWGRWCNGAEPEWARELPGFAGTQSLVQINLVQVRPASARSRLAEKN